MVNEHNKTLTVILERITYRLTDIGVIRFEEMVYILEQCFRALNTLFIHLGKTFYIDEDSICFNTKG